MFSRRSPPTPEPSPLRRLRTNTIRLILEAGLRDRVREFESELESELGGLHEGVGELSPIRRVYPDAMLEHMGHAAAETESDLTGMLELSLASC